MENPNHILKKLFAWFTCPKCCAWWWDKSHKPSVRKLEGRHGVGDLEFTYPCGYQDFGDSLPEFR